MNSKKSNESKTDRYGNKPTIIEFNNFVQTKQTIKVTITESTK